MEAHDSPPPIREFADRGVQWLLESPENVRGLLQILSTDSAVAIDFSRMVRERTTLIPDTLRKREADLVFRAPYREAHGGQTREVLIYILIEHQSTPDPAMGFRILYYVTQLWDRQRRDWEEREVPESQWRFLPVVPVVFYTGSRAWNAVPDITAVMDLPEALRGFVPAFEVLFLNLKATSPETLTASDHPLGWVLRVLREEESTPEVLAAALQEAIRHLNQLPAAQRAAWERAIHFMLLLVFHRREPPERGELVATIEKEVRQKQRAEVTTMAQTIAEALIEEGMAKGALRARRDILLSQLHEKFGSVPDAVSQRVWALEDAGALDALARRVIHARTIDEMQLN